jgi:hypothetical protein
MSALNKTVAERIATLFRLLGSNFEGEVLGAVAAMKRLFASEHLTFHDIATVIESCNGEIEEKKYSDTDAEIIFSRGVETGRAEEARKRPLAEPTEFYDADGHPQWHAIAMHCQKNCQRLDRRHHEFINDMAGNTVWRPPTEKQGKYLLSLFIRLGNGRQQ